MNPLTIYKPLLVTRLPMMVARFRITQESPCISRPPPPNLLIATDQSAGQGEVFQVQATLAACKCSTAADSQCTQYTIALTNGRTSASRTNETTRVNGVGDSRTG